jgi:hypothetical protein
MDLELRLQNTILPNPSRPPRKRVKEEDLTTWLRTKRIKIKQEEIERTDLLSLKLQHTDPLVIGSSDQSSRTSLNNPKNESIKPATADTAVHHQTFKTAVSTSASNTDDDVFHMGYLQANVAPTKVVDLRAVRPLSEQIASTTEISNITGDSVRQDPEMMDLSAASASVDKPEPLLQNQEVINPKDIETPIFTEPAIVSPEPIVSAQPSSEFQPRSKTISSLEEESQGVGVEAAIQEGGNMSDTETILEEINHAITPDMPVITESSPLEEATLSGGIAPATAETPSISTTMDVDIPKATENLSESDYTRNLLDGSLEDPLTKNAEPENVVLAHEIVVTENPTENVILKEVESVEMVAANLDIPGPPAHATLGDDMTRDLDDREIANDVPAPAPVSAVAADAQSTKSVEVPVDKIKSGDTNSFEVPNEDTQRPCPTLTPEVHPEQVPLNTIEPVAQLPEVVSERIDSPVTFLPTPVEKLATSDSRSNISISTIPTEQAERVVTSPSVNEVDPILAGSTSTENSSLISHPSSIPDNMSSPFVNSSTMSQPSGSPRIPQTTSPIRSPISAQQTIGYPIPGDPWQARQPIPSPPSVFAPIPKIYFRSLGQRITVPKPQTNSDPISSEPGLNELRPKTPSLKIIPLSIATTIPTTSQSPKDRSQTTSPTVPLKIKLKYREPPSPESPPPFKRRRRRTRSNSFLTEEPEPEIFDCIVVRTDFENVYDPFPHGLTNRLLKISKWISMNIYHRFRRPLDIGRS